MVSPSIPPERWRRIQALFHEALARPPVERPGFLDSACGEDGGLRSEVEALLVADADHVELMAAGPEELATLLPDEEPPVSGGDRVGPYRVERQIGQGGMGVVYLARDTRLDRPVALKFLPAHLGRDENAKQRFLGEARAASALDHPNICTIYDVGETVEGWLYIAMAYYEGPTLDRHMAQTPLSVEESIEIAAQVAEALTVAHQRGVVHRDVKPGNVLLTADGTVKLLDFGIAKVPDLDRTGAETALGTIAYMSPEQARGASVDARTDLWSLGVILYEMITGRRPFPGARASSVVHAILDAEPRAFARTVPGHLARIVERALEKEPDARYQSAAELLAHVRDVQRGATPVAAPSRHPSRRAVLLGGALLLLVAVGAFRVWPAPTPALTSIAVLPLEDLSRSPDDYFADGMTEAVIADLAQIEALRVISRSSVMPYKANPRPVAEIADELGVDAVIEGSVLRADGRVRITVQLIEATTDRHLWARSYERGLGDVLALQRQVARAIVGEVRAVLTPEEQARLSEPGRVDPAVHEAYLKGRHHWNRRTAEGLRQAIVFFEEALDGDPTFAPAYAGLAESHHLLVWYAGVRPEEAFPRTVAAARRALELDSTLAEPWTALALSHWQYEGDLARADDAFRQALALNTGYASAHQSYGQFLSLTGRFDEGVAALRRAQALDPLSPVIATDLASAYLFEGRHDEAVTRYRQVLDLDPRFPLAHVFLGMAHVARGEGDEAVAALERAIELGGRNPLWLAELGRAYADAGRRAEARAVLEELTGLARERFVSPFALSFVHVGLGDADAAFEALREAEAVRDPYRIYLGQHPHLDPLRDDPRFATLVGQTAGGP